MIANSIFTGLKRSLLPVLLVTVFSLAFAVFPSNHALASTAGPTFSGIFPANGATVKNTYVTISLKVIDPNLIDSTTVVMQVDGVKVSPHFYYIPIDESTDDPTQLEIYYTTTFPVGTHAIDVTIKNMLNISSSYSWSFTVNNPTKILSLTPTNGANTVSQTPTISAAITPGANIASIVMTLNNAAVTPAYNQASGVISYTPQAPLTNETFYNAALSFKDASGNNLSATWQFYVNTFQEMSFSMDDSTCQKCHNRTKHPMNNCTRCHGLNLDPNQPVYPLDDCYKCHYNWAKTYPATWHTTGLPTANPPTHGVTLNDSCVVCHNQKWPTTTIPSTHSIFNTAIGHTATFKTTACTDCHSTSLTREHQRRSDANGNPLTCLICHNSPDSNVQNAIATKNPTCSACHNQSGDVHHSLPIVSNCIYCHPIHTL